MVEPVGIEPTTLRVEQVLKDCGAGDVAAVQVSGPSGVCLTPDEFRRHIAFEDVPTAGAFMIFGKDRDLFEVRQLGERFNGIEEDRNPRNSGGLVRRSVVCEPNSDCSPAFCA